MINYNELMNKPVVNGKELIGSMKISGLPGVTSEDVGKVLMVNESGDWVPGTITPSGGGFSGNTLHFVTNITATTNENESEG